jgi:hypothetical protein
MEPLTEQTLRAVLRELPTFHCLSDGIDELLRPSYGVISGFQDLLEEIEDLRGLDLFEINPLLKGEQQCSQR